MTMWLPNLDDGTTPRYRAIADAIGRDVDRGILIPGARLPTHRELARHLGVTVGTVTRGYAEAERRGLTVGEVGRGTFVKGEDELEGYGAGVSALGPGRRVIDMSLSTPWTPPEDARLLHRTLEEIAREGVADLLYYQADTAFPRHRTVIADWLAGLGVSVGPERIVVTSGAQHALTLLLSTLLRPGDVFLTAELTYPGVKALARMHGLHIRGVALDDEGVDPDDLARVCEETRAKVLYCVPTIQNPTGGTMSEERRRRIARVAREHDLLIVEDEVHVGLVDEPVAPIWASAPERTIHLTTPSKSVTFGLRVGFVVAPDPLVERIRAGVRSTLWMPPPLMTEIATRWLTDGTAEELVKRKRVELSARWELIEEVLGRTHRVLGGPGSVHAWLHLPEPWRRDELVAQARQRGVLVAGAEAFAVGRRNVPHAVRLGVGAVVERDRFRQGIEIIADILEGCCDPCADIL